MRNTLLLKYILPFICFFAAASRVDAAERIIRPRRVNRSAPKVSAPYAEDGASQAPMASLTPPDDAIWPSGSRKEPGDESELPSLHFYPENGGNSSKASRNDNPAATARSVPPTATDKGGNSDPAARSEVAETSDEPESAANEGPEPRRKGLSLRRKSRAAASGPDKKAATEPGKSERRAADMDSEALEAGLPPYVPYDQYQEMNERRQDFAAPHPDTKESPAPRPAPGAGQPPKYRELSELEQAPAPSEAPAARSHAAAPPILHADGVAEPFAASIPEYPTPAEVENYRRRLEFRLLERYNNLPDHAGQVAKVSVVLSKPLQPSLDGTRLRAEFDQLVYDPWGKRIPALEKEYYVVTFGSGGARQVRSDPSIRVGLNLERTYSEPGPDLAEKVKTMPSDHAFRAAPSPEAPAVKMPDWWRPEFADDGY